MKWSNNMSKYEFKGTRGHWCQSSESEAIIKREFSGIGSNEGALIASAMSYPGSALYATEQEAAYNAQAISAVPELIEALNDCVALLVSGDLMAEEALFVNGDLMAEDCGPKYRAACAALAKATGESTGGE